MDGMSAFSDLFSIRFYGGRGQETNLAVQRYGLSFSNQISGIAGDFLCQLDIRNGKE
ncbi:hypothetical protein J7E26_14950 [Bacillus sp. ISL-51]|nr:hypothetical protein [Bacillus sp. ISL-51]